MTILVEGPAWGVAGVSGSIVRNPLRVENVIFNVVDRLVPGVISTTPHARYLSLHGLIRSEAERRGLSTSEARDLTRRCEAVTAAISHHHEHHRVVIPEAHGQSRITGLLGKDGSLVVAEASSVGRYSEAASGFYGTYRGPEVALGVVSDGADQVPGDRYQDKMVRPVLGEIFVLADSEVLSAHDLQEAAHLCPCAADGSEAEWLRGIICGWAGGEAHAVKDEARRSTAQIIARTIGASSVPIEKLATKVRADISFGPPLGGGAYAGIEAAEAWRGLMLRNHSVGAWRNLWSWIVEELTEPHSARAIGDVLASKLPGDWKVADLIGHLQPGTESGLLMPVEDELRGAVPSPDPLTELKLLAAGARRLDEIDGRALAVLAGDGADDLGPLWVRAELEANGDRPLRSWASDLVGRLLLRSQRIAMLKLDVSNPLAPRLPAQVIERDGIWHKQMSAGSGEPGMRISRLMSMMAGAGALGHDGQSWWLTASGEALL